MALIRTDYGLIYNTDGSLCATLLPEGGVAVTEGTENLVDNPTMLGETGIHSWFSIYQLGVVYSIVNEAYISGTKSQRIQYTSATNDGGQLNRGIRFSLDLTIGETYTFSFYGKKWEEIHPISWYLHNVTGITQKKENLGDGWVRYEYTFKVDDNPVSVYIRPNENRDYSFDVLMNAPQLEQKPYATPFVEGTRPPGALSYDLSNKININGNWTIAKWVELEPYYMDKTLSGTNAIDKYRLPLLELGQTYYTIGHGVLGVYGAWGEYDTPKTICIMATKDRNQLYSATVTLTEEEYNNKILAVLSKSGPMLTAYIYTIENKYVLTRDISSFGDISQIAPRLNYHTVTTSNRMYCKRHLNTLVLPYAVSPETVATWHSLDAPFYDPREQIDAGARKIYAPGVLIDNTGAWGIANGVRQAGFGTDGKWMAGAGAIVADAAGFHGYDPQAGYAKTFDITARGEIRDKDGYSIIDVNGKFNGKIILSGCLDSTEGATSLIMNNIIVPSGKRWVLFVIPISAIDIPAATTGKTVKWLWHFIELHFNCVNFGSTIPSGSYATLEFFINHYAEAWYSYTDATSESLQNNFEVYYEIREISI